MSVKKETVYCQNCPIVNVCWGSDSNIRELKNKTNYEDNCVLAKLYNGELKVEIKSTGYVTRD